MVLVAALTCAAGERLAGATGSDAAHAVRVTPEGMTHALTLCTVVVAVWMPIPDSRIVNSTIASSRFIVGPPSITTTRCQTGSR